MTFEEKAVFNPESPVPEKSEIDRERMYSEEEANALAYQIAEELPVRVTVIEMDTCKYSIPVKAYYLSIRYCKWKGIIEENYNLYVDNPQQWQKLRDFIKTAAVFLGYADQEKGIEEEERNKRVNAIGAINQKIKEDGSLGDLDDQPF